METSPATTCCSSASLRPSPPFTHPWCSTRRTDPVPDRSSVSPRDRWSWCWPPRSTGSTRAKGSAPGWPAGGSALCWCRSWPARYRQHLGRSSGARAVEETDQESINKWRTRVSNLEALCESFLVMDVRNCGIQPEAHLDYVTEEGRHHESQREMVQDVGDPLLKFTLVKVYQC